MGCIESHKKIKATKQEAVQLTDNDNGGAMVKSEERGLLL
jgi:hypothetical protein